MAPWWTIVIPTRASAAWLQTLIDHYAARGIRPVFLLDERSTDGTAQILQRSGLPLHRIGGFAFTEAAVRGSREVVSTPWALWLHDDEFPSAGLLARLAGPPPRGDVQSVAIQRRWIWHEPGQPLSYGRSQHWPDRAGVPGADHAWRLFRPDRVRFISIMHTDGFRIDRWSRFGAECFIAHFEWVVRSRAQRVAKLRGYDRHRYGYGAFFHRLYIPEDQPPGSTDFLSMGGEQLDDLARTYYAARGPDPIETPLSPSERWQRFRARACLKLGLGAHGDRERVGVDPCPENEVQER